eukprot:8077642-Pyramimonas_sp.AAC.1
MPPIPRRHACAAEGLMPCAAASCCAVALQPYCMTPRAALLPVRPVPVQPCALLHNLPERIPALVGACERNATEPCACRVISSTQCKQLN